MLGIITLNCGSHMAGVRPFAEVTSEVTSETLELFMYPLTLAFLYMMRPLLSMFCSIVHPSRFLLSVSLSLSNTHTVTLSQSLSLKHTHSLSLFLSSLSSHPMIPILPSSLSSLQCDGFSVVQRRRFGEGLPPPPPSHLSESPPRE